MPSPLYFVFLACLFMGSAAGAVDAGGQVCEQITRVTATGRGRQFFTNIGKLTCPLALGIDCIDIECNLIVGDVELHATTRACSTCDLFLEVLQILLPKMMPPAKYGPVQLNTKDCKCNKHSNNVMVEPKETSSIETGGEQNNNNAVIEYKSNALTGEGSQNNGVFEHARLHFIGMIMSIGFAMIVSMMI